MLPMWSSVPELPNNSQAGGDVSAVPESRPRQRVPHTGERFRGILEDSKRGVYKVVRYPIPGQSLCYMFEHLRTTTDGRVVYRCTGCRKEGKTVLDGCDLVGDPVHLPHVCRPWKNAQERACHELPKDPRNANLKPRQVYQKIANQVFESEMERDDMLHYFYRNGYESRRRVIARACRCGLKALVADGVHDLQPSVTNKAGQVYIIHGVVANSVDMSLLYAITLRKNEQTYDTIFGMMKDAIAAAGGAQDLRIVVDFEKAAINAAKRAFPSASVEGCAFHLAQAWNRKRDALGLRSQVRGNLRCALIKQWWETIKGNHAAYIKCRMFLDYLKKNWYKGIFRKMWNKWNKSDLRTSNIAETFNKVLGDLFGGTKYPRMSELIRVLQGCAVNARGAIIDVERRPAEPKKLRKKDRDRRYLINREMHRFKRVLRRDMRWIRTSTITAYCRRMSRYVTEKVFNGYD
ncbi:hypothetical protein OSTOST_07889 [Ostertagia ostertagi]